MTRIEFVSKNKKIEEKVEVEEKKIEEEKCITINEFDLSQIKPHRFALMVGGRGTGKTTLASSYLEATSNNLDFAIAFCPSTDDREAISEFIDPEFVYGEFDEVKLEKLIEMQRIRFDNKLPIANILVVLSECLYYSKKASCDTIRNLHMNSRCLKISVLRMEQYLIDYNKSERSQIDYIFSTREMNETFQKNLHSNFFSLVSSFEDFSLLHKETTKDRNVILLDRTIPSSANPSDYLFRFKAMPSTSVKSKIGSKRPELFDTIKKEFKERLSKIVTEEKIEEITTTQIKQQEEIQKVISVVKEEKCSDSTKKDMIAIYIPAKEFVGKKITFTMTLTME